MRVEKDMRDRAKDDLVEGLEHDGEGGRECGYLGRRSTRDVRVEG